MENNTPEPDITGRPEPLLRRELDLIALLLADPGLCALRRLSPFHSAVKRYDSISGYLAGTVGFRYPDETDLALEIGGVLLDASLPGDTITPEDVLKLIGDTDVLEQLRKRVANQRQFHDQMAAIACWNLLRANGVAPTLVEKDGLPDISVPVSSEETEWLEVKRIQKGSKPGRARKVIKKANDQIKRADLDGVGAVFMQIERPQQSVVFDDSIPMEVNDYVKEVERELGSGGSKSVATVVIAWDDYMLIGDYPEPTMYVLRRRTIVRKHRTPRSVLSCSNSDLI